ncbi:hypothetical protein KC326_g177 [Hortaea werneckii]|nr:hypothetical protein KC326_g177 [Hortaea werneckii]
MRLARAVEYSGPGQLPCPGPLSGLMMAWKLISGLIFLLSCLLVDFSVLHEESDERMHTEAIEKDSPEIVGQGYSRETVRHASRRLVKSDRGACPCGPFMGGNTISQALRCILNHKVTAKYLIFPGRSVCSSYENEETTKRVLLSIVSISSLRYGYALDIEYAQSGLRYREQVPRNIRQQRRFGQRSIPSALHMGNWQLSSHTVARSPN